MPVPLECVNARLEPPKAVLLNMRFMDVLTVADKLPSDADTFTTVCITTRGPQDSPEDDKSRKKDK